MLEHTHSRDARTRSRAGRARARDANAHSRDARPHSRDARPHSRDVRPHSRDARPHSRDVRPHSRDACARNAHARARCERTRERPRERARCARGQTSIDFVVGMSVFLLTVAFVVGFLPGIFEPFTLSNEGDVLAADRTATLLAEQLLADPTNPAILDADCTAEFFDAAGDGAGGVAGCEYSTDASDLDAALGLGATTNVNVTIAENGTLRSANGVTLGAGPTPPAGESAIVSHRVVMLDGEESDLYVRVW